MKEATYKATTAEELKNVLLRHDHATIEASYTYAGDLDTTRARLDEYVANYPRTKDTLHYQVLISHYERVCPGGWLYTPRPDNVGGGIVLIQAGTDIVLEAIALYEIDCKNIRRYAKELDEWLARHSIVKQIQLPRKRMSAHVSNNSKEPSERTKERHTIFEAIRKRYPTASQAKVAMIASDENNTEYSENTVRNTYRAMGVKWPRADRIR